jgi:predicted Zn-dependent protease
MNGVIGFLRLSNAGIQRDVRLLVIKKERNQIFRLLFETDTKDADLMALHFKRIIFSFKRLCQKEILNIKPLRIRFKTVSRGDSVEVLARDMPINRFALEWFELLNKIERDTSLIIGNRVRVIAEY